MAMSLEPLFRPQSVAVIGASRDERSISGMLVGNLVESFRGPLYLVNPRAERVGALPSDASLLDTPGPVDLAFIAVPARHVSVAVRECIAKPVRGIVVISAGFAEMGGATQALENEMLAQVRAARIPLLGPNCLGVLSTDPQSPLNGTFAPSMPPRGNIALATQSGALGFVLPDLLRSQNLGLAALVSLGNKLDIGENDFLRHWQSDPSARMIVLYLESLQNPRELFNLGCQLTDDRPVIMLKSGRTTAGSRAAGSHTAALATPDRLTDGLCRQAGILRVETLEELFHVASLVTTQPRPRGKRMAVVTNAGGLGVLCTDALVGEGCEVPELSAALQAKLRDLVPPHATVRNPIDLVASTDPQLVERCLECLLASEDVDAVVVMYVPRGPETSLGIARAIHQVGSAARHAKPVLAVFAERDEVFAKLQQELIGIPCFRYPESAARALAIVANHAARQSVPDLPPVAIDPASAAQARFLVEPLLVERDAAGLWLAPEHVYRLLGGFQLPLPAWQVADSQTIAVQAAQHMGFPVVMKAIAPNLLHKSAAGGVVLDIRNGDEARQAWHALAAKTPSLTGVLVQQYVPGGEEAMIGVKCEPGFGHVVGLGAGGTRAERLAQIEFRLLPLAGGDAYALIRDSAVADICLTAAGQLTTVGCAVYEALLRLSALVAVIPELRELDLNPVALGSAPRPLSVLDARMFVSAGSRAK